MPKRPCASGCLFAVLFVLMTLGGAADSVYGQSPTEFVPVTDAMLQDPAPGDWLMWRRTLDGWGYSPLNEINRDNVDELRLVWSRGMTLSLIHI